MVNVELLEKEIQKNGFTRTVFCQKIKMSEAAFLWKMKRGAFKSMEAKRIAEVLHLKRPEDIFFKKN